jgi:hypothetical protein
VRRFLAALLLLIAVPAWADQAPLRILGVWHRQAGDADRSDRAYRLMQEMTALGPKLNMQFIWKEDINSGAGIPLIAYGRGIGSYFGSASNFDALVIIGWDYASGASASARFDSLGTVAQYPTIPVLEIGWFHRPGANSADSVGFSDVAGNVGSYPTLGKVSVIGSNYRLQMGSYAQNFLFYLPFADGSTSLVLGGITATGIVGDTAICVHRTLPTGVGITAATMVGSAGEANSMRAMGPRLLMVMRWLADFPAAKRPNLNIPIAFHIDDGWRYTGFFKPQHLAAASAWMDSIASRRIKYTIGVAEDSIPNYYNAQIGVWDRGSDLCKFTPHEHQGGDVQQVNTRLRPSDIYGAFAVRTNCDADPVGTDADTMSVYMNLKTATDTLSNYFGPSRIDRCVMPPADDWTPNQLNTTGQCTIERLYDAFAHAGYHAVRFNQATSPFIPTGGVAGNYYGNATWPTSFTTPHGPLRLIPCPGYLCAATTDSMASQVNPDLAATQLVRSTLMGGMVNANAVSTAGTGSAYLFVIHNVNLKINAAGGGGVGWYQVREMADLMDAAKYIYGQPVWKWVWSEELGQR